MLWDEAHSRKLGHVVRRLRAERGLSQEAVAYAAQVSKNEIQIIELSRSSGRRDATSVCNPRISTLVKVASALQTPVSAILAEIGM